MLSRRTAPGARRERVRSRRRPCHRRLREVRPDRDLHGDAGDIDQIAAFETPTTIRFTRFGGASFGPGPGCNFLPNDQNTIDCAKNGVTRVVLDLGDGDDVASISPSIKIPVIFDGADGRDGLFGGGGTDVFDGGPGNDNIISRDGRAEQVTAASATTPRSPTTATRATPAKRSRATPTSTACAARPTATTPTRASTPARSTSPTTGSTRTAPGSTPSTSTAMPTASPRPQDCDDTVAAVRPARPR